MGTFYPIWSTTAACNTTSANQLLGAGTVVRVSNLSSTVAAHVAQGGSAIAATVASLGVPQSDHIDIMRTAQSEYLAYYAGAAGSINIATGDMRE